MNQSDEPGLGAAQGSADICRLPVYRVMEGFVCQPTEGSDADGRTVALRHAFLRQGVDGLADAVVSL